MRTSTAALVPIPAKITSRTGTFSLTAYLLALHKLSVFDWHLTEDQGWRIEIKKDPKLTEVGAWPKDSMVPPLTRDPAQRRETRDAADFARRLETHL